MANAITISHRLGKRIGKAKNYQGAPGAAITQDHEKGVAWLTRATACGYEPAQSQLGRMYSVGEGVKQDAKKAAEWYRKAADQGNATAKEWLKKHEMQ
ncbi:tetratricopeptide repeat protein [Candidatus Magnetaquicoccus inordinatus]|uniref:tetratricopeptide repeat protein n=1 Tax=Candidatus Magnetaquicoccus inordinatus TaxID=2496818 RepID=UPI00187D1144|nr:SEL1-like repeat protein [Candidatus Magnetaquicoccus inordinatus]